MNKLDEPWYLLDHMDWLHDTGQRLRTANNKEVEVWEYNHSDNDAILSAWARHFRNHYCLDSDIDHLRQSHSRKDYLNQLKFPTQTGAPGPSIRAGDFCEILMADFFSWIFDFWVPRLRWSCKVIRNESSKGCDILGFKFTDINNVSENDVLAICETKAKFTVGGDINLLQNAIAGSAKDSRRINESLNYLRQRFYDKGQFDKADVIARFQNPIDHPYQEVYTAAAIFSSNAYLETKITETNTQEFPVKPYLHNKADSLKLIVIKGDNMMQLTNDLYLRAADEA